MKKGKAVKSFGKIVRYFVPVAITVGAVGLAGIAQARPGELDPSFGIEGKVQISVGSDANQIARDSITTADGKTLIVGTSDPGANGLIARYNSNGNLDPTFDGDGVTEGLTTDWDRVAIQDDGKIVVAGRKDDSIAIARYNPDGSPDLGFATGGLFTFVPGPTPDPPLGDLPVAITVLALRVLPDGHIRAISRTSECNGANVVSNGTAEGCTNTSELVLTEDGSVEPTFGGGDGYLVLNLKSIKTGARLRQDGSVTVVGSRASYEVGNGEFPTSHILSARFTDTGEVDETFVGSDNFFDGGDYNADEIAVKEDTAGHIYASFGGTLIRFTETGALDDTFGRKGLLYPRLTNFIYRNASLQISDFRFDDHNRLVFTGGVSSYGGIHLATTGFIARLTPTGEADGSFGGGGIARLWSGLPRNYEDPNHGFTNEKWFSPNRLVMRADGSFLVAGTSSPDGSGTRFTLAASQGGEFEVPKCNGVPATFVGTEGPDKLATYGGVVVTLAGDDVIKSRYSDVCSGDGDDQITSKQDGELHGGPGNDVVDAPNGSEDISGGPGDDAITGGPTDDLIIGGSGNDTIESLGGYDRLRGDSGSDLLRGGALDDHLVGGSGRDRLFGGKGRDQLFGGPGRDVLKPGPLGPVVDIYKGLTADARMEIVRTGRRVHVDGYLAVTCDTGQTGHLTTGFDFKVNPNAGRFKFSEDTAQDIEVGGPILSGIKGEFSPRNVEGQLRFYMNWNVVDEFGDPDEPACWTGKSKKKPWVPFKAKLTPKPKQFAKQ
ncbi:MAG: hypothetical protein JJE13_00740 [Thermoleophilia bacterium]|nr:hypothetical protein [Thermoleophilia bacterium]